MPLSALSCNQEHMRETLKLRYCAQVSMDFLDDLAHIEHDDPQIAQRAEKEPTKSRIMRKLENVQATLGSELIVSGRRRHRAETMLLPKLNKHNSAEVIIPTLIRSTTDPTPRRIEL
ncbi:Aste57867_21097 [Aphanomyces stellatus]|uniref:Aste57867_21097 protein n=1 Tax=Aphanomyces stellatus TaxID=120398 RepID=A0A485LI33_9STRA|nr:hypothetical protein As57867_021029 [Aphanomyces stellatus]VFT97771.1 Aste57867_21097 [Aphanomyces stellatus]